MNNVLSVIDKKFMDNLVNNSGGEVTYNEDITTLIFSEIDYNYHNKTVLYKNIKLLLDKFHFIHKENMSAVDNYICKRLADFIIGKFIYHTDITNFPKSLFNNTFLDFLINHKLFFTEHQIGIKQDSVFNIVLGISNNYFNMKYNSKYDIQYTNQAQKLKIFLNQQLLSYVILNKYEVNLIHNFLKLIEPSFTTQNSKSSLYTSVFDLFETFYNGISHMISINIESVEFYKKVYKNKTYSDINLSIDTYKTVLSELGEMNILTNDLFNKTTNFNIDNFTETDIQTLTHMSNDYTHIGNNYEGFKRIFTPVLLNILRSDKTNIHDKTTVLLSIKEDELRFIVEYIKIFISIEKYNSGTGFKFKTKIRTRILSMINNFLQNNPDTDLKTYISDSFITLYTNHINSIVSIISDIIIEIKNYPLGNTRMLLMKYLICLDQSVCFNKVFYKFFTNDNESVYHFKIIESYYTILQAFISNKLYSQLSFIKETSSLQLVELGSWQIVDALFTNIFSILYNLSQNEAFITCWTTNRFFYNKDTFNKTCEEYGSFNVTDDYTITDLLKKISINIENKIQTIADTEDTYDIEIPDDFKDPIMLTPINQPVEIPSVKIIVDKYTIYNHLIFNETNPFTNESLTVTDLEVYNSNDEVKERVKIFIDKFNNWKCLHKT